jgi:preprotein translocase SecE subunit
MARDRKRAKQRRARQRSVVPPSKPRRVNVPGELDHASGEADEFDAALVAGADGEEAPVEDALLEATPEVDESEPEASDQGWPDEGQSDQESGPDAPTSTSQEDEPAVVTRGAGGVARREAAAPAERREGNAVLNFLRASWAELQRVQWPDRRQVAQATAVVLGFVALAGAYLGVADYVFNKLVDKII